MNFFATFISLPRNNTKSLRKTFAFDLKSIDIVLLPQQIIWQKIQTNLSSVRKLGVSLNHLEVLHLDEIIVNLPQDLYLVYGHLA